MRSSKFQFTHVEQALAAMHKVADAKRSAFQGRLKHYQKQGFPAGINTGRGRAAVYNLKHALQLAIALEMNQVGLNPERAAQICVDRAERIRVAIHWTASKVLSDDQETTLLVFDPEALSDLRGDAGWDETLMTFDVISVPEFRANLSDATNLPSRRYALVDVTAVVTALVCALRTAAGISEQDLWREAIEVTKTSGGWQVGNP